MSVESAFSKYVSFLENLTFDKTEGLSNYVHAKVVFSDPFHNVMGEKNMIKVL